MAFVLYKGIDWRRRITVTSETTGARTDLTGRDLKLHLRRRTGEAVILELSAGSGITLLAQSGTTVGQADVEIDGAATLLLDVAAYTVSVLLDDQVVGAPTKLPVRAL